MKTNTCREIREELILLGEEKYRDFSVMLIPAVKKESIIGIRIPALRAYANRIYKDAQASEFMRDLPHVYFEENNLHAFLIEKIGDYGECIKELDLFLPYVDNWSTCDSMRPRIFASHKSELIYDIRRWISSEHSYTIRFGIEMLMVHFLGDAFKTEYADAVADIRSDEYYVNMMIAWYFATALAKNWDEAVKYIEKGRLSDWVHNKAIGKATESYRITSDQKAYLRTLKRQRSV